MTSTEESESRDMPPESHFSQRELSVLWAKTAAEAQALQYQAYNIAKDRLDEELESHQGYHKLAVIADIDETVLDTSDFQAGMILDRRTFPSGWSQWIDAAQARGVPGAAEFLQYAAEKGVEVFYITNRRSSALKGTMKNLRDLGFPNARQDRILCKDDSSDKEPRRKSISADYRVVLLLGDNLNDFSYAFYGSNATDRAASVTKLRSEFGRKFIILPNPMYGHWESAMYDYNRRLSPYQLEEIRHRLLRAQSAPENGKSNPLPSP